MDNRLYLRGFPTADSHQHSFSFLDSEGHRGWSRTYQRGTILPLFLKNIKGDLMMLKNLLNRRVTLGRLIVVLLFAGGLVFAGTFDGFVVKTEAEKNSCCGGDVTCSDNAIAQPEVKSCCGSSKIAALPSNGTDSSVSEDDDPCGCITQTECGSTSCDPNKCTVMKCATGCGGDCGCTAQCNTTDCSTDDAVFPCPGSDTRSPE